MHWTIVREYRDLFDDGCCTWIYLNLRTTNYENRTMVLPAPTGGLARLAVRDTIALPSVNLRQATEVRDG